MKSIGSVTEKSTAKAKESKTNRWKSRNFDKRDYFFFVVFLSFPFSDSPPATVRVVGVVIITVIGIGIGLVFVIIMVITIIIANLVISSFAISVGLFVAFCESTSFHANKFPLGLPLPQCP